MNFLNEIFSELPPKYKELQYFQKDQLNSTDVATLLIKLDEQVFQTLVVIQTQSSQRLFLPNLDSGIWKEQHGKSELNQTINDIRTRIKNLVIPPLKEKIQQLQGSDDEVKQAQHKKATEVEKLYSTLLFKLGTETLKNPVLKEIINMRLLKTNEANITMSTFDSIKGCIGFLDGVYDFNRSKFVVGSEAAKLYVTKTVGYEYAELLDIDEDTHKDYIKFLKTIHSNPPILNFVLKKLSNSLRGIQEQCLVIHYNISGKNGKTTLFKLIKKTFGSYFMKCNVSLLYPATFNTPSASNEELMSLQGILCALFSEPSAKQKLSASMIKEITGGDEQSTRRNYGTKETFEFPGLAHVLCNKIPELDEYDGGIARRMLCIPYTSTFVDNEADVDETHNKYLRDMDVDKKFGTWCFCLMKTLIEFKDIIVPTPDIVVQHTSKYLDRENIMKNFIEETLEASDNMRDILKQTELYKMYLRYCKENNHIPLKCNVAYDDFHALLDEARFVERSTSYRNFWKGYKIKGIECDIEDELDS